MQIRTIERDELSDALRGSRLGGRDTAEMLDRAGILLTPARLKQIRANLLNQLAQELEDTPTTHYLQAGARITVPEFQGVLANILRKMATKEAKS